MKRTVFLVLSIVAISSIACSPMPEKKGSPHTSSPSSYVAEEGFVDAHGVLIYYKALGKGQPLVVLHGGPGASHDYLLPYLLPLIRRNRVIFIDERGSGRSQQLENPSAYTVENMAEDARLNRAPIAFNTNCCNSMLSTDYSPIWETPT